MSSHQSEMEFENLAPTEVPVKLGDKRYVLVEASADAVIKYRDEAMSGAVFDINTKTVTRTSGGSKAEVIAVAACLYELYEVQGETKRRPVLVAQVLGWKNSIVAQLFDRLKSISPGMLLSADVEAVKEDQENSKKSPDNGTDSFDSPTS